MNILAVPHDLSEEVVMCADTDRNDLKVGLAERVITPPLGVPMAGFAARKGGAQGVHDDLYVRALVVEGAEISAAMMSASLVGLSDDVIAHVRREVARRTGLPESNLMMTANHTHSGPVLTDEYRPFLKEQCIECIVTAWETRFEGSLGVGKGYIDGVGRNRRRLEYGGLPVDPEAGIIKVEDGAGTLRGVLFNYACHPTVMGPRNLLISEDWPYYAIQTVKEEVGRDTIVMFANGAEGDINPGYSSGLSGIGAYIPIRTWEYTEEIGVRAGRAILSALPAIQTCDGIAVQSVTEKVDLPLRRGFPFTVEQAERKLREAERRLQAFIAQGEKAPKRARDQAEVEVFFARYTVDRARWFYSAEKEELIPIELQALQLSDAVFVTFPGEVFVEIGLEVKQRSPFPKTFVIGLANNGRTGGYLPTREEYQEGDYEVVGTQYDETAGEVLVEAALDLIGKLPLL